MSSKEMSRSTSSSAGASPATVAVRPDPHGHLHLDGGRRPAGQGHRRPVGRHPGVDHEPDDRVGEPEVRLNGGRVEADLPAHRRRAGGQRGVPAGELGLHAAGHGSGGGGRVTVGHGPSLPQDGVGVRGPDAAARPPDPGAPGSWR